MPGSACGAARPDAGNPATAMTDHPETTGAADRSPRSPALSPALRDAIGEATAAAFAGRRELPTPWGEAVTADDVARCHRLAAALEPLCSAGRADTAALIEKRYPPLVPYFIAAGEKNPAHHTACVMEFMAAILLGEGLGDGPAVTVGMLAALFHDVALGLSELPKITEQHLRDKIADLVGGRCMLPQFEKYLATAVEARREHMKKGGAIAREMLADRGLPDFAAYGFRDDTVYRTATGHALFCRLSGMDGVSPEWR